MHVSTVFAHLCSNEENLDFPQLEELDIWDPSNLSSHGKGLVQKILDGAPKLDKIMHGGERRILKIIRPHHYRLLRKLEFKDDFSDNELNDLTWKLVQSGPRLTELSLSYGYNPSTCEPLFHSLVESSSDSLENLKLRGATSIDKVKEFPVLPNVTLLSLRSDHRQLFEYLDQFQFVRFGDLFPKLEQVDLHVEYDYKDIQIPPQSVDQVDREFSHIVQDPSYCAQTTKHLKLEMELYPLALLQLEKSFPNLAKLKLFSESFTGRAVPYRLIFRFWPDLKTLFISSGTWDLEDKALPNWDAEFCGINQEEVELLRGKEEEYLRNLHIVPVRPCVSTMKSKEQREVLAHHLTKTRINYAVETDDTLMYYTFRFGVVIYQIFGKDFRPP